MSLMTDTLKRIYSKEATKSIEEVKQQLSFFPFQLSDEAYEFYQWAGAPTGERFPEDWDVYYNDNSTYDCCLERFLGIGSDFIYFLSIEEAQKYYYEDDHKTYFPFVSYEYGFLVLVGSQNPIESSPVLKLEDRTGKLWFPSLTNMMLATAECIETINTILPDGYCDDGIYSEEKYQTEIDTMNYIANKYGSSSGWIVTN